MELIGWALGNGSEVRQMAFLYKQGDLGNMLMDIR